MDAPEVLRLRSIESDQLTQHTRKETVMAKEQLDALENEGKGVGTIKIASIEKLISKYERKKE